MQVPISKRIVDGYVASGFESVAAEFQRNFVERGEIGAAFTAIHEGKTVLDVWGGSARLGVPWRQDTLQLMFSGTKGLVAGCMMILLERGLIEMDAPIADYWPEFASGGKERILVRHMVSHRAGAPGVVVPLEVKDIADDRKIEALLAAQPISNDPNAFACYHGLSIGWLCGAILRRVDGRSIGQFFADEIAKPLDLELWIGLPDALEDRVSLVEMEAPGAWNNGDLSDPVNRSIWGNPVLFGAGDVAWNRRDFWRSEIAGAGAIGTARSMAKYFACLADGGELDGVRLLAESTILSARRELSRFDDPFFGEPMAFGTVFKLQTSRQSFGPASDAFGHTGAGGSVHGAWPSLRTGFSYAMNQLRADPNDVRSRAVLAELHTAVLRQ